MADTFERLGIQLYIDDSGLNNSNLSLGGIKKALGDVSKITDELSKKLNSTFGAELEKNARSLSGKLADYLKFDKASKEATELKKVLTNALTLEGVASGLSKLQKFEDTMVKVGNSVYHVKTQTEELKKALQSVTSAGVLDSTKISVLSKDKYEAEIQRMGRLQAQAYDEDVKRKEDADTRKRRSQEKLAADIIALEKRVQAETDAIQRQRDQQALTAIKAGAATPYSAGVTTKSSYVWDVSTAQSMANTEQIKRTLDELYKKSLDTKLSVQQVGEAFKQAGIDATKLDGVDLRRINSGLTQMRSGIVAASNGFKELTQTSTIWSRIVGNMLSRLVEFYSIRTVLFAVGGAFREAVKDSLEFNQQIHDIIAISGTASSEFNNISSSILDIAKSSRFTANEIAGLMQVLAQAGVAADNLPDVAKSVNIFASASATDPKLAADLFTTAMNVYNIKAENSAKITNALTAALNKSKLEASGLATAFNYLAPQAAQLGYSMEETLGIIATMAQSGIKPSTIGTGVSQLLKEFSAPKARLKTLLQQYNIDPADINPINNSFDQIVGKLRAANVESTHLFQALESRVGRSVVTALNLGSDAFKNMTNSITGTMAATVAYDEAMEGSKAKMNQIKQEFLALAVAVGNNLAPAFNVAAEAMKSFFIAMNTDTGKAVATVGTIAAALGSIIVIGKSVSAFFATELGATILGALGLVEAPLALIVAGLTAIGVAIASIGYSMGSSRRESEAHTKALINQYTANKNMLDVLNKIKSEEEAKNTQLKEYQTLLDNGKEKEAAKLGAQKVSITRDNRKAIADLISNYPQYFKNLDKEIITYKELTSAIKERNKELSKGAISAAEQYNQKIDTIAGKKSREIQTLDTRERELEGFIAQNPTSTSASKQLKALKERKQKVVAELRKELAADDVQNLKKLAQAAPLDTGEEYANTEQYIASDVNITKLRKVKIPKIEDTKAPTPLNFNKGSGKAEESYLAYADGKLNKMDSETAKQLKQASEDILRDTNATYENRMQAYELISDLINEEAVAASKAAADEEGKKFAASHKGVKYDAESNVLIGANTSSADYKKYQDLLKARNREIAATAKKEQDKINLELTNITKKASDDYDREVQKIEEDSAKRQAEVAKKILEQQFKSEFTTSEESVKAYFEYLEAAYEKIATEYDKKIKNYDEKFKAKYGTNISDSQKAEYRKAISELNAAEADTKNAVRVETNTMVTSVADSNISKKEKFIGYDLANTQAALALQKSQAITGEQINKIEAESEQAVLKSYEAKQRVYNLEFSRQYALLKERELQEGILPLEDAQVQKVSALKQQLTEVNNLIDQQKIKVKEANDESFMGNFEQGLRKGTQSLGSFKSMTQELGSSVVTTFSGGMTNALTGMVDALGRGENAWKSFASTMGNMLKSIGDMLVKYVMQLMVVWAVQQLVGLVAGGSGGGTKLSDGTSMGGWTSPSTTSFSFLPKAEGGIIQHFANGGLSTLGGYIPTNVGIQGKDSVPAMLMPGEYVIKKDMVDLYGVDYLKALNQGKIQKFAEGGSVGGSSSSGASPKDNDGTPYSFSIINVADVNSIPPIDGQAVVNIVSFDAAKKGPTYHTIKGIMQNS